MKKTVKTKVFANRLRTDLVRFVNQQNLSGIHLCTHEQARNICGRYHDSSRPYRSPILTIMGGSRYQAYLEQAGSRPNLKVLVNAPVARILSAPGEGFVASGVEFLYDGQKYTVSTTERGEVILSAGSVSRYLAPGCPANCTIGL